MPLTCGLKKRAATLDMTTNAVKPWKFGTLARMAYPGIFELAHSMGYVIGVLPSTLKSNALVRVLPDVLAIDDQILSEGLLKPGVELIALARGLAVARSTRTHEAPATSKTGRSKITGSLQPMLASTRFSLNGVSIVRA